MSTGFILLGITHSKNDAHHHCMHGTTKSDLGHNTEVIQIRCPLSLSLEPRKRISPNNSSWRVCLLASWSQQRPVSVGSLRLQGFRARGILQPSCTSEPEPETLASAMTIARKRGWLVCTLKSKEFSCWRLAFRVVRGHKFV